MLLLADVTIPTWLVIFVVGLVVTLPVVSRFLRAHDHPELADKLDRAESALACLAKAIAVADHTGAVARAVSDFAPDHGVEDHPTVKKITT